MEQDDLAIDVLDEDMERLGTSVDFWIPLEVGDDREVNSKERPRDGLDLSLKPTEILSYRPSFVFRWRTYWSLGKVCTNRCTLLPSFGKPNSSPISGGLCRKKPHLAPLQTTHDI